MDELELIRADLAKIEAKVIAWGLTTKDPYWANSALQHLKNFDFAARLACLDAPASIAPKDEPDVSEFL